MKKTFSGIACALALAFGGAAQAGVATFDSPSLIDISDTFVVTYDEAGARFQSDGVSFGLADSIGTGSSGAFVGLAGSPFTLTSTNGGTFSLLSLDYGLLDASSADPSPSISLVGLFANGPARTQNLTPGTLQGFVFQDWSGLKQVTFSGNSDYVLDNVSVANLAPVPEPAPLAMMSAGLAVLWVARRKRLGVRGRSAS